jgi:opacity protein-like surface antigen
MVTEINQYANNREGINLNTYANIKNLKIFIDYANAREIKNLYNDPRVGFTRDNQNTRGVYTNGISFQHRTHQLIRSRFGFFERYLGPYNRIMNIYRRSYDNIQITDTIVNYKKHFNTMDLTLKYKTKILTKDLILSNYINYNSVQDFLSPIPVVNESAFLRQLYEEFMAFYQIHSKVTIIGFVAFERVLGNKRTELADSLGNLITSYNKNEETNFAKKPVYRPDGKPINQFAFGYGVGIDYQFSKRSTLNIRSRWFDHYDKHFTKDRFSGHEITTELKIFF